MAGAAATAAITQPTMFVSHGGGPCFMFTAKEFPMFAGMDSTSPTADFLRALPSSLPRTPEAILVVSAHWETPPGTVGVLDAPSGKPFDLLYDYYGFPEPAYHLDWKPNGHSSVAERARSLLEDAGFAKPDDAETASRGLDHGVFVPLSVAWPKADIPIVQVSLEASLDPLVHLRIGAALSPLAAANVLILGSGALTHNLSMMRGGAPGGGASATWAADFCGAVNTALTRTDSPATEALAALQGWSKLPSAHVAHPREEHLLPLLVVAGAAAPDAVARLNGTVASDGDADRLAAPLAATRIHTSMVRNSFSMDAFRFEASGAT